VRSRALFKGPTKDDYVLPAAHYEMAVLAWFEACDPDCWPTSEVDADEADKLKATAEGAHEAAVKEFRVKKAEEAQAWLDKVTKWETFVLDSRIGMRVQTGVDCLKWFRNKMEAA
jgi:hypothetical protein